MAFDPAITELLPAATNPDATHVSIALADLPGMTEAALDVTTGDLRQLVLSFNMALVEWYNALATEDRPSALIPRLTPGAALSSGDFAGKQRYTFQIEFYVDQPSPVVADEPA